MLPRRLTALAFASVFAASAMSTACSGGKTNDGVASAEPAPSWSATPLPSASQARVVEATPPSAPSPPTLRAVRAHEKTATEPDDWGHGVHVFTVPGAVLLTTWNRVGRVTPDDIEWLGKLGLPWTATGRGVIQSASGRYPDAIDITYETNGGRVHRPTFHPLTGKGNAFTFSAGGGMAWITGSARIGESVLVAGYDMFDGYKIAGVRGPAITRLPVPWKLRCEGSPRLGGLGDAHASPAVVPTAFAASSAGTLFSYGALCEKTPAVEVWPKEGGQPRIVELGDQQQEPGHAILVGRDDTVWLTGKPFLVWKGDRFEPLPSPPGEVKHAFVSTIGELHVASDDAISRWDGQRWADIARLTWPSDFNEIAVDGDAIWATTAHGLYRLQPTEPAATGAACKTPLVFLYDVAPRSEPTYSFPATRKALASFSPIEGVELVDFVAGRRRLGAKVPSWEVGVALAAHVEKSMTNERPKVVCFAPENARVVPRDGAK